MESESRFDGDYEKATAFPFTETRIEAAIEAVRRGKVSTGSDGRRRWRDGGSRHGLVVLTSAHGATYYRVSKSNGKQTRVRIGDATATRVSKARDVAMKLAAGNREAAPPPVRVRTDGPTVAQAWASYMEDATSGEFIVGRKQAAKSTLESYERLYKYHIKKPYGAKSLHTLAKDVQAIHKKLREKKVTANRLLQVLSNLFVHAARSRHWDKPNPTLDPITGKTIRKYSVASRERFLTTDEASKVLAYAASEPEPWGDFWPLLILTGVRLSNLLEMKWTQLELRDDRATWNIPTTKNGEPHVVPLTSDAVAILRQRHERAPKVKAGRTGKTASEYVFPHRRDPSRCMVNPDPAWERVRQATGISDVRIHDLRRTAASWATQAGAPISAVGKFVGHKSISATAVYARADVTAARQVGELVAERMREAMERRPK